MTSNRTWDALHQWLPDLGISLVRCESFKELFGSKRSAGEVVLLDWATSDGMLIDENQQEFRRICKTVPVILLIPHGWRRMLTPGDLGVAALHAKPLELHLLMQQVRSLASEWRVLDTGAAEAAKGCATAANHEIRCAFPACQSASLRNLGCVECGKPMCARHATGSDGGLRCKDPACVLARSSPTRDEVLGVLRN